MVLYFQLVSAWLLRKCKFCFVFSILNWFSNLWCYKPFSRDHKKCLLSDRYGWITNTFYLFDIAVDSCWSGKLPGWCLWNIVYSRCRAKPVSLLSCTHFCQIHVESTFLSFCKVLFSYFILLHLPISVKYYIENYYVYWYNICCIYFKV